MIYEVRTYDLKPGSVAAVEKAFEVALPARTSPSENGLAPRFQYPVDFQEVAGEGVLEPRGQPILAGRCSGGFFHGKRITHGMAHAVDGGTRPGNNPYAFASTACRRTCWLLN